MKPGNAGFLCWIGWVGFSRLASVEAGVSIGLGAAVNAGAYHTLYLMGRVDGVIGVFRSTDEGANWVRINDDQHQYGNAGQVIAGDPRLFGRVYLGTDGRGLLYADPAYSSMANRGSGKCVEVAGGSTANNADIQQNACTSTQLVQAWTLVDLGNGYQQLRNRGTGMCMRDVGGNIVQYDCHNGYWSEQFTLQDLGNGYSLVKNRGSDACLRVENSSKSDGASIVTASCNPDWWSQQFSFSPAQ